MTVVYLFTDLFKYLYIHINIFYFDVAVSILWRQQHRNKIFFYKNGIYDF